MSESEDEEGGGFKSFIDKMDRLVLPLQGVGDISLVATELNKLSEDPDFLSNPLRIEFTLKILATAFDQSTRPNIYGTRRVGRLVKRGANNLVLRPWPEMMLLYRWLSRIARAPKGQYEAVMTEAMEATGFSRSTLAAQVKKKEEYWSLYF